MSENKPQPKYRTDYRPANYLIDTVDLHFDIQTQYTDVTARIALRRNPQGQGDSLRLDGRVMTLQSLAIDGKEIPTALYSVDDAGLTLQQLPDAGTLTVKNRIEPDANTALEGFYRSGNILCTQCEPQGFSRITYFPDRPDMLAQFRATLVADAKTCPVLLSNGDCVDSGDAGAGRHYVVWEDPHPKPCYLFAAVAGDLACVKDSYTTQSGKTVALRFYTEYGNERRCLHGIDALKKAMAWDETTYGLAYDLTTYMVVAVGSFNMGAMENKGLNIFNTACVLASPETATDRDYATVLSVIGHEYFHNYTGNRVTLRDWFQLSLKESLTVFREQQFAATQDSAGLQRIEQVRMLRSLQFPEDAGPTAHPVRPESYIEMNNFYTMTIYEKGAEVIRMLHTLLGHAAFTAAVQHYLHKHDGQAATIEDFLSALEDSAQTDLSQFRLWYTQAGTPQLQASSEYDAKQQRLVLRLRQYTAPTPGQKTKQPLHVPVGFALASDDEGMSHAQLLELRETEQQWVFERVTQEPTLSLLRDFSAPVQLQDDESPQALARLARLETDAFARWEALQRLYLKALVAGVTGEPDGAARQILFEVIGQLLREPPADDALLAELLSLPEQGYLAEQFDAIDVDSVVASHDNLRQTIAAHFEQQLLALLARTESSADYTYNRAEAGRRRLTGLALGYLAAIDSAGIRQRCLAHYQTCDNLTDRMAALGALRDLQCRERTQVYDSFEQRWMDTPLVLNKWFALQATSRAPGALARVRALLEHPRFTLSNPNRVRSVLRSFARSNMPAFHAVDGAGYRLLADQVLALDAINPQMAAGLVSPLARWRRYADPQGGAMHAALQRIEKQPALSGNVYEIVAKSLQETAPG